MVIWHIKLKGIISSAGYTAKNYPMIILVALGGVKRSDIIRFLPERGDLRWRTIECVLVTNDIRFYVRYFPLYCYILYLILMIYFSNLFEFPPLQRGWAFDMTVHYYLLLSVHSYIFSK